MKHACTALLALALVAASVSAQTLPIKPLPADAAPGVCPAVPVHAAKPAAASRAAIDSLLTAGGRAAILGDHAAAEEALRRAAQLDPSNAVVSYRLARTLDDEGRSGDAALEYCRYLALTPTAPDAAEIRERARSLLLSGPAAPAEPWKAEARVGVQAYAAGRHADAVQAFTRVLQHAPDLPEAFYNRGVAHLAAGSRAEAAADLDAYLRLRPDAEDAGPVRAQVNELRGQTTARTQIDGAGTPARGSVPRGAETRGADPRPADVSDAERDATETAVPPLRSAAPERVLVQGLVVPGLGQHATGRTILGVGVLGAVGGAVYFAMRQETVVRPVEAQDPFGNRYEYDVRTRERPNLTLGLGAAVGIGVAAAIESYLYARGRSSAAPGVAASSGASEPLRWLSVTPTSDGVRLGVRLQAGRKAAVAGAAAP